MGTLTAKVITPEAAGLVDEVFALVHPLDAGKLQRSGGKRQDGLRRALEALTGDLLWNYPALTFIPTNAREFSRQEVSHRAFKAAVEAMGEAGLAGLAAQAARTKGDFYVPGGDGVAQFDGNWAPRFQPMPLLLSMADRWGVLENPKDHFTRRPRRPTRTGLIVLRGRGRGHGEGKTKGNKLRLPEGPYLERLRDDVERINAAIARAGVEGCPLPVLFRAFTLTIGDGNKPALHGRFYTPGKDGYVQMPKVLRKGMTISGEPIAEADVSASQFWCFYGAASRFGLVERDPSHHRDLYAVPGLPRAVVKAFVAATWGQGKLPTNWPRGAKEDLAEQGIAIKDHSISKVREAVLREHPVLHHLERVLIAAGLDAFEGHTPASLCSLWLMGIEAEALRMALLTLLEEDGVMALPLHDALLVPESKAERAMERLREAFWWAAGIKPRITIKTPRGWPQQLS
jgi:hypothetical protein